MLATALLWPCLLEFAHARPPRAPAALTQSAQAPADLEQPVTIERRQDNGYQTLFAHNHYPAPAEVQLDTRGLENMTADAPLAQRFVVPPMATVRIAAVYLSNPALNGFLRYAYQSVLGDPTVRPDLGFSYLPPIPPGSTYPVSQGFHGRNSHTGPQNRYAVDIVMPENTTIHAARGGVVVAVQEGFAEGGNNHALKYRANQIRIVHDDGSMAVYGHLGFKSARVTPGQPVAAGQAIGASGNTGYSTAPHLHFAVQRNAGMSLESLPFRFRMPDGSSRMPQEGSWLYGLVPD